MEPGNYTHGYISIGLSLPRSDISASQPLVQQQVSDIAHFVKGSLITYFPMTNSL